MHFGSNVFSAMFLMTFVVYIFLGIQIVFRAGRSVRTLLFLAINVALAVWSFGYAYAVRAESMHTSLTWYRFSALGWTLFYALMLHFSVFLTRRKNSSGHTKWIWLLYLPAVFFVFSYALSPAEASRLFNLNQTGAGWINRPGSSWIELAFTVYYMIYHVLSTILIIVWGIRTADKAIRNQSKLLTLSLLFAMIFGNMFDRYYHTDFTGRELPQLAPVFILMPMVSAYYAIRHFGFLGNDVINEDEVIMNSRNRLDIYSKLAAFLVIIGFISLPIQYFVAVKPGYNSVAEMIYSSSLFFSIALLVYLINKLKFFDGIREPLFAMAQAVIIPIVILRYADIASVTVWAVPVIPILLAVIYNSYFALAVLTGSSIMSIVLVMIAAPELIVRIDVADHIARLVIMLIIVIGAIQVNRLYLSRLKQNADQIQLQKQISEMTNLMLDVNADNLEQRMTHMLRSSARFLGSDSGAVYYYHADTRRTVRAFSWYDTERYIFDDDQLEVSEDAYKWTNSMLKVDGILIIRNIDDIPEEEQLMRKYFQHFGIESLVIKLLGDKDNVIGAITFSSTEETMVWDEGQLEFVNILSNIAFSAIERVNREQTIQSLAYYDRLTGLVNRSRFLELAGMRVEQATADDRQLAISFMDLDAFKAVNDSIGHDGGDELLKRLATQMQSVIRKNDMLGRFGGDEFLLLLDPVDNEQHALDLLSPIIAMFQEPFKLRGNRYQVTVSAGLALFPRDGEDLDTLIQNADLAMYEAKNLGKNQAFFCNESLKAANSRQALLANDLHVALEENQLFLHYQPQIELASGRIIGTEALLRWQHPAFGLIPPGDFIPLAEKNGMIHAIGEYVLRQACLQGKLWQKQFKRSIVVAVNLSLRQLISTSLVGKISRVLEDTGFDPGLLELEITESTASIGLAESTQMLTELKALGVRLAIDDFGTQYSSLNRIRQLPIDTIKIDRQFISNLKVDIKDTAIVNLIISLAAGLNIDIVAEGVETELQLEYLKSIGCGYVQGFYFYRPMPAAEIDKLIAQAQPPT